MQKTILIGHVGKEPEAKDLGDNKVVKFPFATSEKYTNKKGEKIENTEWFNISVFGKLADVVQQWVKKGDKLYLETKQKTSTYEKNGETKYFIEHILQNMEMLGGAKEKAQAETGVSKKVADTAFKDTDNNLATENGDLPF